MQKAAPKISVIIPAYNAARWLGRAIESALNQTLPPHQVIVVDDGSTDHTPDVVSRYGASIISLRIDNTGVSVARNLGMKNAAGDWLAFLDADDLWVPDKLKRIMEHAAHIPDAALFSHDAFVVDESDEVTGLYSFRPSISTNAAADLVKGNWVMTSTVVMRSVAARETGEFREDLKRKAGCEDWDYWIRTASKFRIEHIPIPLTFYRRLEGSATRSGLDDLLDDSLKVIEDNGTALGISKEEMKVARAAAWRAGAVRRLAAYDSRTTRYELEQARSMSGLRLSDILLYIATLLPGSLQRGLRRLKRKQDTLRGRRIFGGMKETPP